MKRTNGVGHMMVNETVLGSKKGRKVKERDPSKNLSRKDFRKL